MGLPPLPNKTYLYTAHSWVIGGHQSNVFLYRPLLEYRRSPNQAYLYTAHSWSIGGHRCGKELRVFSRTHGVVVIGRRAPDFDPAPSARSHDPPSWQIGRVPQHPGKTCYFRLAAVWKNSGFFQPQWWDCNRAPRARLRSGAGRRISRPPFLAEGPCAIASRQNLSVQAGRCEGELRVFPSTAVGLQSGTACPTAIRHRAPHLTTFSRDVQGDTGRQEFKGIGGLPEFKGIDGLL